MKSAAELRAIAERLKRATRNTDILDVCDALLALLAAPATSPNAGEPGPKRDRAAYMRGYRSRKRNGVAA